MDIIDRLNDGEKFYDAVDDAITEIGYLRNMLKECLPYVEDMVGIASAARPLKAEIERYFNKLSGECIHGWEDWNDCPVCCH